MAVRKFILSFGQSNGGPSPEYSLWVEKHPELNLRLVVDPANKYANSPYGSYNDQFTMPGSFYGYSTVSLFGRAVRAIRYLTHYHPLGSGYSSYPGTGRVLASTVDNSTPPVYSLYVNTYIQNWNSNASNANAFSVVRQIDGNTYSITGTQERTFAATINAGNVTAYPGTSPTTVLRIVANDKFRFLNVGTNTAINTSTDYYVLVVTGNNFTFSASQGGAAITGLTSTGTTIDMQWAANVSTRLTTTGWTNPAVNEQFTYPVTTLSAASHGTLPLTQHSVPINVRAGGYWVGTWLGCNLKRVSDGAVRRIVGGTGYTVIIESDFTGGPISQNDQFTIESPTGSFATWGYFLPWSPFEGLTENTKQFEPPVLANNYNPYPPGFNYPNHWHLPTDYQPFAAAYGMTPNGISYHVGLAAAIQNAISEDLYVIASDFGGSSLAHNELAAGAGAYGWHDPKQQSSWAPGEPNNCFARLMAELDSGIYAAAQSGDTLECVGVFFIQGETDSAYPSMADRYGYNLRSFKTRIRQELKNRNLWPGDAEKIPWVQPKISTVYSGWTYASTVNSAIETEVEADRYMRTFDADDIPLKAAPDNMHYNGYGAVILEQRCYSAWQSIRYAQQDQANQVLSICNLALSHIGDTASIESIDPPDGSTQAALCSKFYPIARDSMLDMRSWTFATRRKSLVALNNTRTEWDYAYAVPADCTTSFAILPPDAKDDYSTRYSPTDSPGYPANIFPIVAAGAYIPQPYTIETDEYGQQIIYTDQANAVIRYSASGTDASKFSPLFKMALSWHLASMLAGPIIKGDVGAAEAKRCAQMAQYYVGQADESDSNQRQIKPEHIVPWMSGR